MILKALYFIITILIFISCDNSPTNSPETGISSNPNFIRGKIVSTDKTPIANALVELINIEDTLQDSTDINGAFSIEVEQKKVYVMNVCYNGITILHLDSVSSSTNPDNFIFETNYIDSVSIDIDTNRVNHDSTIIDSTKDSSLHIDTTSTNTRTILYLQTNAYYDTFIRFGKDKSIADDTTNLSDMLLQTIGFNNNSQVYSRYIGKIKALHPEIENCSKYILELSLASEYTFTVFDTLKTYMILKSWDIATISAINSSPNYFWNKTGISLDDVDAQKIPFFSDNISNIITNNKLTIDITIAYKQWESGVENNGFLITFGENRMNTTSEIVVHSSEYSILAPKLYVY